MLIHKLAKLAIKTRLLSQARQFSQQTGRLFKWSRFQVSNSTLTTSAIQISLTYIKNWCSLLYLIQFSMYEFR